jgi:uncharacterized protein YndB with AHSA1/START domain
MTTHTEPAPELVRRTIAAGEARVAVLRRTYDAPLADLWDACTNPERLARWYTNVTGDLRVGGTFSQELMGDGVVLACDAPHFLHVSLGGGRDEVEVRLTALDENTTELELQHATTFGEHEIAGAMYDAIYCMGGGYYPRLYALAMHLDGTLPADYVVTEFHLNPDMRPSIDRGSQAMQDLLDASTEG